MIRSVLIPALISFVLLGCTPHYAGIQDAPKPTRIEFKPAAVQSWHLANGLRVFFLPDRELPTVSAVLYLPGGILRAKPEDLGPLSAMGSLMRDAGAGNLSAQELDRELELLSISIGSSYGEEFGSLTLSSLIGDKERAFQLFSDVLRHPRFQNDRVELWKKKAADRIARRRDDPQNVAGIGFDQLLYTDSIYGKVLVSSELASINKALLFKLHQQVITPTGAILALSGDLDREQAEKLVSNYFADWQPKPDRLGALAKLETKAAHGIYFVEQPLEQATVILGQRGVPRFTPDYAAIDVFNQVFSGGFGSRLYASIRERLGLSYSVFGQIMPYVVDGKNFVFLQTKGGQVAKAVEESIKVVKELQKQPVSTEELENAKHAIQNSYVFRFQQPFDLVNRQALMLLQDYPPDFDQTYLQKIGATSPAQILQVARERWNPAQFATIVVGDSSAYNSLAAAVNQPGSLLFGAQLKKVNFDQKLIF